MRTDSEDLRALRERLEEIERKNRNLWRLLVLGVFAASVGFGGAHAVSQDARVIEAERFVVRDAKGNARAVFGMDKDGTTGLTVRDDEKNDRIALGVKRDGTAGLALNDGDGKLRAGLTSTEQGKSGLSLYGDDRKIRAGIGVDRDGQPRIGMGIPIPPG